MMLSDASGDSRKVSDTSLIDALIVGVEGCDNAERLAIDSCCCNSEGMLLILK